MRTLANEEDNFDTPLTPLIDIVFLLLIFFLVATNFNRKEIEQKVDLPSADGGKAMSLVGRNLIVNVRSDETLVINQRVVIAAELPAIIDAWKIAHPHQHIVLRSDGSVPYRQVMKILGICRAQGVEKVDLPVSGK